jgi:hypothetical protein
MDNGLIALVLSPALAVIGVLIGKWVDKRANDGRHATDLIKALQEEIGRRDKRDARLEGRFRRLEDYTNLLRRALREAGLEVAPWPADEKEPAA